MSLARCITYSLPRLSTASPVGVSASRFDLRLHGDLEPPMRGAKTGSRRCRRRARPAPLRLSSSGVPTEKPPAPSSSQTLSESCSDRSRSWLESRTNLPLLPGPGTQEGHDLDPARQIEEAVISSRTIRRGVCASARAIITRCRSPSLRIAEVAAQERLDAGDRDRVRRSAAASLSASPTLPAREGLPGERDDVVDAEARIELALREHHGEFRRALRRRTHGRNVFAVEQHDSVERRLQPRDRPHEGRFPGRVAAEDADEVAGPA